MTIKVQDTYVRDNRGSLELHVNDRGKLIKNPPGEELGEVMAPQQQKRERKKIAELQENDQNIELLRERGVSTVITTTPRYQGRSFGTNLMEAALTAYADRGRRLTDAELNALIDDLDLRPCVQHLTPAP